MQMIQWAKNNFLLSENYFLLFFVGPTGSQILVGGRNCEEDKGFMCYVLILSNLMSSATYFRCIRSNGDTQLLILHWIPISTPHSMDRNSALEETDRSSADTSNYWFVHNATGLIAHNKKR